LIKKIEGIANPSIILKTAAGLFLLVPVLASALEEKPWLGTVYEFTLDTGYSYNRFTRVEGATFQPHHPFNDHLLFFDLGFTIADSFDLQVEGEFVNTPVQSFSWRSFATQGRYRLLDDITGDFASVVLGLNLRFVSERSLRDVSAPYASRLDLELFGSIGKEWSKEGKWTSRSFVYTALGQGTNGLPWVRADIVYEHNWADRQRIDIFGLSNWGFGGKHRVDLEEFNGWGRYHHQAIDLGIGYSYVFDYWGKLRFSYAHRIYAKVFPEHVNFFMLSYHLPFSLF